MPRHKLKCFGWYCRLLLQMSYFVTVISRMKIIFIYVQFMGANYLPNLLFFIKLINLSEIPGERFFPLLSIIYKFSFRKLFFKFSIEFNKLPYFSPRISVNL